METPSERIRRLQAEIERERQNIANCNHEFGEPVSNPETYQEATSFRMEAHGSDVWPVADGYSTRTKPRWTRTCKKCGTQQHTYTMKPIIVGHAPDFGAVR